MLKSSPKNIKFQLKVIFFYLRAIFKFFIRILEINNTTQTFVTNLSNFV